MSCPGLSDGGQKRVRVQGQSEVASYGGHHCDLGGGKGKPGTPLPGASSPAQAQEASAQIAPPSLATRGGASTSPSEKPQSPEVGMGEPHCHWFCPVQSPGAETVWTEQPPGYRGSLPAQGACRPLSAILLYGEHLPFRDALGLSGCVQ